MALKRFSNAPTKYEKLPKLVVENVFFSVKGGNTKNRHRKIFPFFASAYVLRVRYILYGTHTHIHTPNDPSTVRQNTRTRHAYVRTVYCTYNTYSHSRQQSSERSTACSKHLEKWYIRGTLPYIETINIFIGIPSSNKSGWMHFAKMYTIKIHLLDGPQIQYQRVRCT